MTNILKAAKLYYVLTLIGIGAAGPLGSTFAIHPDIATPAEVSVIGNRHFIPKGLTAGPSDHCFVWIFMYMLMCASLIV